MRKLASNSGKASGISRNDVDKIERDMVLDLHQKTDYQQDLLTGITRDLVDTHSNLVVVTQEIKQQEGQIGRIHVNVKDTETSVKRADKNITVMTRRAICQKVLLHILAVLLFIAIVIVFIFKITK
jgi:hypothetical protein